MQYNWKYRKYKSRKKVSTNFDSVVPNPVRVRITKDMILSHTSLNTPFHGISIVPYQDNPGFTKLLSEIKPISWTIDNVWREFKQAIFEQWEPEKIHVIGSSSGYDSRMVAKAIQELWITNGDSWYGETYFVECGGEGTGFKAVMKALGFKNYVIWEPDYPFEYFDNHSDRYNGLCAYPLNQWYDYYQRWNEEDIQYISGYGGNVADAMRSYPKPTVEKRLRLYFKNQYYYQLAAFKQPKDSIHPFWSWRYIKAVCGIKHKEKRTSRFLSRMFVSECEHIARMTILGDVKGLGYLTINPGVIRQLHDWYMSTGYGKRYPETPSRNIEYNKWWLQFCIASYTDKHKIIVE